MKANRTPVNYIQHLAGFYELIARDDRLTTAHVSLYMALFQFWNLNRFQNPISISRNEMMEISKIGSTNTYTKCLKELDTYGYIQYLPSFNPLKGSTVNLFNFDKGTDNSCDKGSSKATNKACERAVRPSINSINKRKHINIKTIEKENSQNEFPSTSKQEKTKVVFQKPTQEQLQEYFTSEKSTNQEAQKFYLHYESNGWMVGKTKMKNWKAAVKNWITRSNEYNQNKEPPNPLSSNTKKNYSEPL